MVWNAYVENINAKVIRPYNIFRHGGFWYDCCEISRKYGDNKEIFLDELRRMLMYRFWAKCEWEVIISDWPPSNREELKIKVDVYQQVMNNWHVFSEYVWENRKEFKKDKYPKE